MIFIAINVMRKQTWFIVLIVLCVLIFGTGFFIARPSGGIAHFFKILIRITSLDRENAELRRQVIDLKNTLSSIEHNIALPVDAAYLWAKVFALYPFNTKNRLYITVGEDQGARPGQAVTFSKTTLVGTIMRTHSDQSEVVTIYDPTFSIPVKIGANEVSGLLYGGVSPRIGLIDKTKHIGADDRIVSASKDVPYGLFIGSVGVVSEDSAGAFFEATVNVPYVLKDINTVFVISL